MLIVCLGIHRRGGDVVLILSVAEDVIVVFCLLGSGILLAWHSQGRVLPVDQEYQEVY
jgi:hypothetical protein